MEYVRDLQYENFIELIEYLETLSESKEKEDLNVFISEKLNNFFPSLTALQSMELSYIVETKRKDLFNIFRENYPDLEIDTSGKSFGTIIDLWSIKEQSLNTLFDTALEFLKESNYKDKSKNKVNSQVFNAKTLAPLINRIFEKNVSYYFIRQKLINKHPDSQLVSIENFHKYETILTGLGYNFETVLYPVISFIINKKFDNFNIFLDHLFSRIDLLFSDKELKSESNKAFKSKIELLISKNK